MTSITDNEIRWQILELLMKNQSESSASWGVHRSIILKELAIPEKNLDFNITYLTQKGLVKIIQVHGTKWLWAKITSVGIDVIKNKEKYQERFSFVGSK